MQNMLTTKDVSEKLHMGINQTRNMINRPDFPKIAMGKKWLIPEKELDKWIKNHVGHSFVMKYDNEQEGKNSDVYIAPELLSIKETAELFNLTVEDVKLIIRNVDRNFYLIIDGQKIKIYKHAFSQFMKEYPDEFWRYIYG